MAPRGRVSLYSGLPPGTPPPAFDTNHIDYHELTVSGTSGATFPIGPPPGPRPLSAES